MLHLAAPCRTVKVTFTLDGTGIMPTLVTGQRNAYRSIVGVMTFVFAIQAQASYLCWVERVEAAGSTLKVRLNQAVVVTIYGSNGQVEHTRNHTEMDFELSEGQ